MGSNSDSKPLICVVIPTYNNCATICSVVRSVLPIVKEVIVVNDGSTDSTKEALQQFPDVCVVTHKRKMGKGASLADGFAHAVKEGFSHAVTMDADGQHLSDDLPNFIEAIRKNPEALVIGVRALSGKGRKLKSRVLRLHSNFWVWAQTRRRIRDSQSGFRAYPLLKIEALKLKTKNYDYEVEAIVKAVLAGIPVIEVPVHVEYGLGSKSQFRPIKDFALVAYLNLCLFMEALLVPAQVRKMMHLVSYDKESTPRRIFRLVRDTLASEFSSAKRFSLSVGLGVFFGIIPIWGFQMAAAFLVARKLGLSGYVSVAASNISFPVTIPFILYGSLLLGRFVLTGMVDCSLHFSNVSLKTVWGFASEYVVGSFILGAVAGLMATILSYLAARFSVRLKRRDL
jgi:glycosyltransferase involved in cell wall biosynthesis